MFLNQGLNPWPPVVEAWSLNSLDHQRSPDMSLNYSINISPQFLPFCCSSSYILLQRIISASLQAVLASSCSVNSCDCGVLMEGGELQVMLSGHVASSPMSVFMPERHCFDYHHFVACFRIKNRNTCPSLFFFKIVLAMCIPLRFHIHFKKYFVFLFLWKTFSILELH